ncbi:MAG: hypothetical protein PHR35_14975 [Kiritimatiellae bacterium]|nr:hypothetical protein [Kiritimatiellia bacterium]
MTQELQELLDRIRQEGVDKARAEAQAILDAARKEAAGIVAEAKASADTTRQEANREAAAFAKRAEQSVRQASRDVQLQVAQALGGLFDRLLRVGVEDALKNDGALTKWVSEAVSAYLKGGEGEVEVSLGGAAAGHADALLAHLRSQASRPEGVKVSASPSFPNGFSLRLAGGRVEHSFTAEAITEALSRLLRPRLAALLKPEA